jgi:hypothetical protein
MPTATLRSSTKPPVFVPWIIAFKAVKSLLLLLVLGIT